MEAYLPMQKVIKLYFIGLLEDWATNRQQKRWNKAKCLENINKNNKNYLKIKVKIFRIKATLQIQRPAFNNSLIGAVFFNNAK